MPPQVQSIEQILQELNPVYQSSIDVINQRKTQIPTMFNAQRQALGAEKIQGFNQINNQMTGRGMSFSGITGEEQANYLSTKYLPGMQQLAQQENDQNLSLSEALSKIDQERRLRAMDTRENQNKTLQSYLAEQRSMEWEKQKFAQSQALERQKMAQSDRQASAAAGPNLSPMVQQISNTLKSKMGKDKFVSPETFRAQMTSWMGAGGSPSAFLDAFGGYVNPVHQTRFGGYY